MAGDTLSITLNKDSSGVKTSGNWVVSSQGDTITCPFKDVTTTVTNASLSFNASGEASVMGTDGVVQYPKFEITATGTYLLGEVTNGSYKIIFSKNGSKTSASAVLPATITRGWQPKKISGSDVTYVAPEGNYFGTFSGGDSGSWEFEIDQYGHAEGTITSTNYNKTVDFFGTHQLDGSISLQESLNSSTYYNGNINSASGTVSGIWKNPNPNIDTSGSFSGSRQ
jgi:hypothetical protein